MKRSEIRGHSVGRLNLSRILLRSMRAISLRNNRRRSASLFCAHDLVRKPDATFRDHASFLRVVFWQSSDAAASRERNSFSAPAQRSEAGEGDHTKCGGGGAPPTILRATRYGWSPLPAVRGGMRWPARGRMKCVARAVVVARHPEVRAQRASKDDGPSAGACILRGRHSARVNAVVAHQRRA
jgi:hypothetical protein